jgi:anti-sigma-K factor RskA
VAPSLEERLGRIAPVKLVATDHPLAAGAGGELVWSGDRQEGYLRVRGLGEVEPSRGVYQLWIFDDTRDPRFPIDGGMFSVRDAKNATFVPIRAPLPVRRPTMFAITLEPAGGVVVSDRKRLLLTANIRE